MLPARGGSVTVAAVGGPARCLPAPSGSENQATAALDAIVFPSAFTVSPTGQWQLNQSLFTQVELISTSPQLVVYALNARAVWSNGTPFSGEDMVANWRRGLELPSPLQHAYRLVTSVVVSPDHHAVTVTFASPFADWRSLFATLLPHAALAAERRGCRAVSPSVDVSAGPYVVGALHGRTVELVRNPRWWGARPALDRLSIVGVGSPATALAWVRRNLAQVATVAPFTEADLAGLESSSSVSSTVGQTAQMVQLVFDLRRGVGADLAFRLGLQQLLIPKSIGVAIAGDVSHDFGNGRSRLAPALLTSQAGVDVVNGGLPPIPTTTTVPNPTPTTTTTLPIVPGGRFVAGRWFDVHGRLVRLRLGIARSLPWARTFASTIEQQLSAGGISTTVTWFTSDVAVAGAIASGRVDAGVLVRTATTSPTAAARWFTLPPGASWTLDNPGGYANPTVTATFVRAAQYLNPVDAAGAYASIERQLSLDVPSIELVTVPQVQVWRTALNNVFRFAWGQPVTTAAGQWSISVPTPTASTVPRSLAPWQTAR